MTKRGETDAEAESLAMIEMISKAYSGGRNATGVIRWYWPRLKPLLDANYLGITDLARNTGIDPSTLRGAVARVRHEATGGTQSATQTRSSKPDIPASGGRLVRAEPKTEPEKRPEPDADGLIDLGDGRRYRRKPNNPNFFEIFIDGKEKPNITEFEPKPLKRK